MKVSVLGCGRWGSFISWYNNRIGNEVLTFGKADSIHFQTLKETGKNEYLEYPKTIKLCSDLKTAIDFADVIIISIPCQALRSFAKEIKEIGCEKPIVLCMKGMEESTGKRLSEVMLECGFDKNQICVWVGPGHIQDFLKGIPNVMMIDGENEKLKAFLVQNLQSSLIKFYIGDDLVGTEIGSATKNVIGLAAGMLDGLNYGSLKGALMCRAAREVARLIKALGGNENSAYGLCHLGDYEATLFSQNSHNRGYGESFVKGNPFAKLAEGVPTTEAVLKMASELGIEVPITEAIHNILQEKKDPKQELSILLARPNKNQFN